MHFFLEIMKNENYLFIILFSLVPKCFHIMHALQIPGTLFSVKSQNWVPLCANFHNFMFTNDKFCHFLDWQNFLI